MDGVRADMFMRTYFIKAESWGTAFEITVGGIHYLVTAKHLFNERELDPKVQIYLDKHGLTPFRARLVGHARGEIDISVLEMLDPMFTARQFAPVKLGFADMKAGGEVFFLGFPYLNFVSATGILKSLPMAFVRKGVVSASSFGPSLMWIDAINNRGFSGGPVFFYGGSLEQITIAGVVSRMYTQLEPVRENGDESKTLGIAENTGLTQAYGMNHALDIIRRARPDESFENVG